MTEMMRCLVKDKSEVGLWMQKRPIPKIGPEAVSYTHLRAHET